MTSKDNVYGAFIDYYGDIKLAVIKDDGNWLIYGAKVYSGLNQYRYIFVVVPRYAGRGENTTLDQLDWVSFQTRTTDDVHKVPQHHLYLDDARKQKMKDKITVLDRTKEETVYVTDDLPIKIRLMHDPKKNNYLQYPDAARLYQALETFNCVIEML